MDARVAAGGLSALADDGRADTGRGSTTRKIDFQDHLLLLRTEESSDGPKSLDEVDPELLKTYAKLGIPAARAGNPRPASTTPTLRARRGRCGVRQRLGRDDLQGGTGQGRRDLLLDLRGDPRASGTGAEVSRHRRAGHATISTRR